MRHIDYVCVEKYVSEFRNDLDIKDIRCDYNSGVSYTRSERISSYELKIDLNL
jgi:hypothetical protein